MKIWHLNLTRARLRVDGIGAAVRRLAQAQEDTGADVSVYGGGPATLEVLRGRLASPAGRPDVVHFHSVFRPLHALAAGRLRRMGVPYVVSPHSGYARESLDRRRVLKSAYAIAVERAFLQRAAGASCLTELERADLAAFAPRLAGLAAVIPNPVGPLAVPRDAAGPGRDRALVVTLCRYDVRQKGLDRLAGIARHCPDADFAVYGEQDKNGRALTDRLRRTSPPNFSLCPPVFGLAKARVLGSADLFALTSRWEGLSMSLAEAMSAAVPCAVSTSVGCALPFAAGGLGLVLDDDPARAARQVEEALADPGRLEAWGRAGAGYAARTFDPQVVGARSLELYRSVLAPVGMGAGRR
ncbi:MAG: glycosyltransferase family 4 protein [Actinomycetota bacterium]